MRVLKVTIVLAVAVFATGTQVFKNIAGTSSYTSPQARIENPLEPDNSKPVDEIVSAEVAATVAEEADLLVSTNAVNRADTLNAQLGMSVNTEGTNNSAIIEKPQLVAPERNSIKDIKTIETAEGDTIQTLAQKYSITEDTIRWANNLKSDALKPGVRLVILPVSGVLHTAQATDTAESLAATYQSTAEQITAFNDLELDGIKAGAQLIIPNGTKPAARPSKSIANGARSSSFSWGGNSVVFAGNRYAYGYCTYYAFNKRAEIGRPIGSNWGNATSWASLAQSSGFKVDKTPEAGAIIQNSGGWNGYGHVGFVERVNPDGSLFVSDMNYVGWNKISTRTVSASQVSLYNYIH